MQGDAPDNPIKVMIDYDYNTAKELAYEVINRARTIVVRSPEGKKTFEARIKSNGEVIKI